MAREFAPRNESLAASRQERERKGERIEDSQREILRSQGERKSPHFRLLLVPSSAAAASDDTCDLRSESEAERETEGEPEERSATTAAQKGGEREGHSHMKIFIQPSDDHAASSSLSSPALILPTPISNSLSSAPAVPFSSLIVRASSASIVMLSNESVEHTRELISPVPRGARVPPNTPITAEGEESIQKERSLLSAALPVSKNASPFLSSQPGLLAGERENPTQTVKESDEREEREQSVISPSLVVLIPDNKSQPITVMAPGQLIGRTPMQQSKAAPVVTKKTPVTQPKTKKWYERLMCGF